MESLNNKFIIVIPVYNGKILFERPAINLRPSRQLNRVPQPPLKMYSH